MPVLVQPRPRRAAATTSTTAGRHVRVELHLGHDHGLRQLHGEPHARRLRRTGAPAAKRRGPRRRLGAMTRRQLPLLRVEQARQRGFELGNGPRALAAGRFGAHARDVGGRDHAAAVAEAVADVRRDPGDPLVGAAHRHHDVAVGLPVERARSARRAGP